MARTTTKDPGARLIVLETLDLLNKAVRSDPNAVPSPALAEQSYVRLVRDLLDLLDNTDT